MKPCVVALFFLTSLFVVSCKKVVEHNPALGIADAPSICIIENSNTSVGFLHAMESWLQKEGIEYSVLPHFTAPDACVWTLTYRGWWEWKEQMHLSEAEIHAYHDGQEAGHEKYMLGRIKDEEFEEGAVKIHRMMDMLFGKAVHYEPTD